MAEERKHTDRCRLTLAQKKVLLDCANFVLAGEWPEEWAHKPETLERAVDKLRAAIKRATEG